MIYTQNIIGIVGSGTMGIGIAQVAAQNGCAVLLYDTNGEQTEKALLQLKKTMARLAEKKKITATESQEICARVQPCHDLQKFSACTLVIEAIIENREVKTALFQKIEAIVSQACVIASNTSSISITSLAAALKSPARFLGIHFFNPAPLMPLVEIIPGLQTQRNLAGEMVLLMKSWGKTPVIANDVPGFIVNRIARPFYGEALRLVEENLATPQEVDATMKILGNFKMGPFELMDLIGIDVNFSVTKTVYSDYFFDPKYKPSLLQQRMTEAKLLGRKTGKGFYDYEENAVNTVTTEMSGTPREEIFLRILAMLINEALEAKRLKIASDEDLELAVQKGVNYPKGLLQWGKELGYGKISAVLQNLYETYQEERYRQSPLLRALAAEEREGSQTEI